jgi:hypothetical protein
MLRYQRNHVAGCKSGDSCRKCPYWIEGRHQGKRWHQSLRTADAKTAAALVQRAILTGKIELEPEAQRMPIAEAIKEFFAEHESRGAAEGTIKSFRKFLGGAPNRNKIDLSKVSPTLPEFAANNGVLYLSDCSGDPRWTSENRPSVDTSKPANGVAEVRTRSVIPWTINSANIFCWDRQF